MFEKATKEYVSLPHVEYDPMRQTTVSDIVFGAQIQLDLIEEGEIEATPLEKRQLTRFVKRWQT